MSGCRYPECEKTKTQRWGLCNRHRKWVENGFIDQQLNILKPLPVVKRYSGCKIEGCTEKHRRNGFCRRHDCMYKRGSIDLLGRRLKPIIRYRAGFGCIKCGQTGKITKGFCKTHYNQFRKKQIDFDGNPLNPPKRIQKYAADDFCKLKCGRRPRVRGFCENCWQKIARGSIDQTGKRLEPPLWKNKGKTCRDKGCNEPAHCRGLCSVHYSRYKKPPRTFINFGKQCKAIGCVSGSHCRGYCIKHYNRWKQRRNLKPVMETHGGETRLPEPGMSGVAEAVGSGRDVDHAQSDLS